MKHRSVGGVVAAVFILQSVVLSQTIPPDKDDLMKGAGAGVAKYADNNGYPGPKHILDMRDTLRLSQQQERKIQALFDDMKRNAVAKGKQIIEREERLEAMFRRGSATTAEVNSLSSEIGKLRGELRAVHLTTHIAARKILTKEQTALYNSIRHGSATKHEGH